MQNEYSIIAFAISLAGAGLAIISFINPALRTAGMILLVSFTTIVVFTLKLQNVAQQQQAVKDALANNKKKMSSILEQFDVHKKIYKIENEIKNMQERVGKRGGIDPLWGLAVLAIIILIVFILLATGVL